MLTSVNFEILQRTTQLVVVHAWEPHISGEYCVDRPPHSHFCLFRQSFIELKRPVASGSGGRPHGKSFSESDMKREKIALLPSMYHNKRRWVWRILEIWSRIPSSYIMKSPNLPTHLATQKYNHFPWMERILHILYLYLSELTPFPFRTTTYSSLALQPKSVDCQLMM